MKSNNDKKCDLEERTFVFAKNVIEYVRKLLKGIARSEIGKQVVRSAGSVGAYYAVIKRFKMYYEVNFL